MNTETTETIRGWVFYDADCVFCSAWAQRTQDLLARRGHHLAPFQANWVRTRLGLKDADPLVEMKLLTAEGRILGGADAIIHLARFIWWAWPMFALAQIPGIKPVLRTLYFLGVRNRFVFGRRCVSQGKPGSRHRHLSSSFYELP